MISGRPASSWTPGEGESEWLSPGRFAALLGLLIVASFPLVITGSEAFAYGDAGLFAYPVAFYHRECFWRGEIPLWNPFNSCGIPFLAQWNTLTLYPLSLFYLLLPLPWSFGVFCLGHLFLAGLGMYFLAHRWARNRLAAAVAGAVFAFNGFTWYGLMWPHILAALAWMPWVVLSMESAWRQGRSLIVVAAVAGGLQLLSGGAEAILQTWLLLGVLWLRQLLAGDIPAWKMGVRALAAGSLAAGLAAAQLLPFLDLLAHSQRGAGYASGGMAGIAAMPITGWMNYLVPLFHCLRNDHGVFVQAGQSWIGSYYLGAGTVALAALAAWRARHQRVWLLAALVLFSLLMALGHRGFLYDALKRPIPLFGFIRFPVKFLILATFALPLLAALGLSWLLALPAPSRPRGWRNLGALALGLIGLMGAILWFAWKNPLPGSSLAVTIGNACVRALFLAMLLACLALLRPETDRKLQRVLQIGLLVALWFDVFTHSSNLSPTVAASALKPGTIRQFFKWDGQLGAGLSRAMQSKASLWRLLSTGTPNLQDDITGRRLSLFMNLNLLDGVPKFDGFYSLDLRDFLEVFKYVYFTTNEAPKLKDFLGISHASNPTNAVDWVARDSFLPLVTAGQRPVFADGPDTLRAMLASNFDPLGRVYLPLEAQGQIHSLGPAEVRLGPTQFSARRLRVEVEAGAPAMVVVAQAFYHWWHPYVDGKAVPLWRANYAFQALEVPAGKHEVNLVYEDRAFAWGILISLLSLVACGAAWFGWRRRPTPANTEPSRSGPGAGGWPNSTANQIPSRHEEDRNYFDNVKFPRWRRLAGLGAPEERQ